MRVAVAAVPYFPRRRVGSWHARHLRCWNTTVPPAAVRSHNPLCRPRLQKSYRGSTVSGYCGVRDEGSGVRGFDRSYHRKKRWMISKLAQRTRPPGPGTALAFACHDFPTEHSAVFEPWPRQLDRKLNRNSTHDRLLDRIAPDSSTATRQTSTDLDRPRQKPP
jgi:hypothetical protein